MMPMNATALPFSPEQNAWYDQAYARLSNDRLRDLLVDLGRHW